MPGVDLDGAVEDVVGVGEIPVAQMGRPRATGVEPLYGPSMSPTGERDQSSARG
jgi:hypothetical protein